MEKYDNNIEIFTISTYLSAYTLYNMYMPIFYKDGVINEFSVCNERKNS